MIDLYATQPHYLDHLLDVSKGLERRVLTPTDTMWRHASLRGESPRMGNLSDPGVATLIAGYYDARGPIHPKRHLGLVEHGAGQTYVDVEHQGYAGGPGWERLEIVCVPGPHAARAWRTNYPELDVVQVGAPRHRHWQRWQRQIGFTFHWPCAKTIETGSAWEDWRDAIEALEFRDEMLGHWHPKWDTPRGGGNPLANWWKRLGVERTADAEVVFERCALLVCDNTSLAYEFAATDRPVLCLNGAGWRKDVEHGLRFWSHVPGLMLDPGDDLAEGIAVALEDGLPLRVNREHAVAEVYGGSRALGRIALRDWVQSLETR